MQHIEKASVYCLVFAFSASVNAVNVLDEICLEKKLREDKVDKSLAILYNRYSLLA